MVNKRTKKFLQKEKKVIKKRKAQQKAPHPKFLKRNRQNTPSSKIDAPLEEEVIDFQEDEVDDNDHDDPAINQIDEPDKESDDDLDLEEDEMSGLETNGAGKEEEEEDIQNLKDEISKHKQELEVLKQEDPEFYSYLAANDASLLKFKDDEDQDSEEDVKANGEDDEDDGEEEEDEDGEDQDGHKKKESNVLKIETVTQWEESAIKEGDISSLKKLALAFRTACHTSDNSRKKQRRFSISSADVFNRILLFVLNHFPKVIDEIFYPEQNQTGKKTKQLPKYQVTKWQKYKSLIKCITANIVHFLTEITEPTMISAFLRCSLRLHRYFGSLTSTPFKFLRVLLSLWSNTSDYNVRDLSLANIRQLGITTPYPFLENCLKGIYLTYVRNSKYINPRTIPNIEAMSDGVVEMFGVDFNCSYQYAFVYIRQLAIHLKNAIGTSVKTSHKSIYNWQYMNSLRVWGKFLCRYGSQSDLKHLVYPFVELVIGAVRQKPTLRYCPLRFHCVRILLNISKAVGIYIPLAGLLLELLERFEVYKKPKPSTAKPIDFTTILKLPSNIIGTKAFQDGVLGEIIRLLLEFFTNNSYHVSFPELILPTTNALKKFLVVCKQEMLKRQITTLLEKLVLNKEYIVRERTKADFAPKDADKMTHFSDQLRAKKSPLELYLPSYLQKYEILQQQVRKLNPTGANSLNEDDEKELVPKKAQKPSEDDDGDDNESDSESEEEKKKAKPKKQKKTKGAKKQKVDEPLDSDDDIFDHDDDDTFSKVPLKSVKKRSKKK